MFTPGMGWPQVNYFDPTGENDRLGKPQVVKFTDRGKPGFLSVHYWRDWSDKRPPLSVVCPNGEIWELDRKSSNGEGWVVKGDWPNLTAHHRS